jgi:hypothetical protein
VPAYVLEEVLGLVLNVLDGGRKIVGSAGVTNGLVPAIGFEEINGRSYLLT